MGRRGEVTEQQEQDAINVLYRAYYSEVNAWADEFIGRIKEGEWDSRDDFIDSMDEEIDGARRVIITYQAQKGLLVSENDDIGIEDLGVDGFDWSGGIPWSQLMYFAFRQDIIDAMDRKDFDINDDELFEEEYDEDEDDED